MTEETAGPGVRRKRFNRRDFLKMGGAGLAGAALLGAARLRRAGAGASTARSRSRIGREASGTLQRLIDKFNKQSKDIKVTGGRCPPTPAQYFDKLRTQFQAGGGDIDVIGGDVIWPAQFAANGWILDLSDRFTESDAEQVPARARRVQHLRGQDLRRAVVHRRGPPLLPQDSWRRRASPEPPATWDELKEQAQKVVQDEGTKRLRLPGRRVRGRGVNGLRVHLTATAARCSTRTTRARWS